MSVFGASNSGTEIIKFLSFLLTVHTSRTALSRSLRASWYLGHCNMKCCMSSIPCTHSHTPDSTQLNMNLRTQVKHLIVRIYLSKLNTKLYVTYTHTDLSPIPVRSAVKSNFTSWCNQNLSKRALNWLTSTTSFGKLFQILTIHHTCRETVFSCIVV